MPRVNRKYLPADLEVVNGFTITREWFMGGYEYDAVKRDAKGYQKISLAQRAGRGLNGFGYKRDAIAAAQAYQGELATRILATYPDHEVTQMHKRNGKTA